MRSWVQMVTMCGVAVFGCSVVDDGESHRIDVIGVNELGITSIVSTRVQDGATSVYTLRGLSNTDREVASFRLTTGTIPDLRSVVGEAESELGSEIVVTVGETETRTLTRETELFYFRDPTQSAAISKFLAIDSVASTLARYANVHVDDEPTDDSVATEQPLYAAGCTAGQLLTSPVAKMCCYTDGILGGNPAGPLYTLFIRGSDTSCITRYHNPYNTGCKAADGVSACNGTACYYGPDGFARPQITNCTSTPRIYYQWITGSGGKCSASVNNYGFPDISGTFPRGQGCPGGNEGYNQWDY